MVADLIKNVQHLSCRSRCCGISIQTPCHSAINSSAGTIVLGILPLLFAVISTALLVKFSCSTVYSHSATPFN